MYKVGDIVLLREDVDSLYARNLHKGDWYVVLGVMEYGGSQFVSIKDEDRVAAWYLSSIFNPVILNGDKRAIKEDDMFRVGQRVWDVVRGEGVVTDILKWEEYPVIVEFDGEVVDIHGNVMKISVLREIVNKMLIFKST